MSIPHVSPFVPLFFALAACAHASSAGVRCARQNAPMKNRAAESFAPRLDAEQSLRRLLDLIRDSRRVGEITAERLREVFGVASTESSGRHGFAERLDRDWSWSFELDPNSAYGPRFEFAFRPDPPNATPAATAICAMGYKAFAAELEAMGFRHDSYRAEHNRIIHEQFERPGMTVQVYTRGEAEAPHQRVAHACVQMVLVN
jgi:hypothetical protein